MGREVTAPLFQRVDPANVPGPSEPEPLGAPAFHALMKASPLRTRDVRLVADAAATDGAAPARAADAPELPEGFSAADAVRCIELLDRRVFRLRSALAARDAVRALVSLRALHGVSESVGAAALAELTAQVEPALRQRDFRAARAALSDILTLVAATKATLVGCAAA
ncbi:hypothetical protein [Georgenia sp. AZ-5]|uniref:hypothetical protein n=1 Tax=Georgenia sp. AZ-5 TaxID=3367526 RepID=UPI003754306B